jgi:hypothetical protein
MAFIGAVPAIPTIQRDDADMRITRWDLALAGILMLAGYFSIRPPGVNGS